jgi:hypothetical protein
MAEDTTKAKTDPRMAQALVCTGGDEQKARALIDGTYKDALILKAKFEIAEAELHCNMMVFAHAETGAFLNISIIIYNNATIWTSSDPSISWRDYYRTCEKIAKSVNLSDASDFVTHLKDALTGYDIFSDMQSSDADSAAYKITGIVEKFYGLKNIECDAFIEPASTLELADERISVCAPQGTQQGNAQEQPAGDTRPEIEKNTQLLVEAKAIISPLNGKRVHDLVKGDRILLMFVNRDGASIKIAEALGAFDENRNYLPIKGRIAEMIPVEKVGYWIYVAIAKNAVAKIVEEGNVQIAVDGSTATAQSVQERKTSADKNIIMYIALLIGLIAVAGLLIYAIM